ncbi:hypothetical protein FQA39_LY19212 [Lamprigera yunnana]|nr:hypothetical protein FQA39_LY19212 [Lamprigera yunnana]
MAAQLLQKPDAEVLDEGLIHQGMLSIFTQMFLDVELNQLPMAHDSASRLIELASAYAFVAPGEESIKGDKAHIREILQLRKTVFDALQTLRSDALPASPMLAAMLQAESTPGFDFAFEKELTMLFGAGTDTASYSIGWALYLLATNPDVQERLHQGMREVYERHGQDRQALQSAIAQHADLRSFIAELLRLYPPLPFITRLAQGADQLSDMAVAPADVVVVSLVGVNHKALERASPWQPDLDAAQQEGFGMGAGTISSFVWGKRRADPHAAGGGIAARAHDLRMGGADAPQGRALAQAGRPRLRCAACGLMAAKAETFRRKMHPARMKIFANPPAKRRPNASQAPVRLAAATHRLQAPRRFFTYISKRQHPPGKRELPSARGNLTGVTMHRIDERTFSVATHTGAATLSNALAPANPWSLVPPLGNLDAYITAVNRIPLLTPAEELDYARKLKESGDVESAGRLVLSHLRLCVSIARQYIGYGLPHGDLIQEGNVGLMKAVKRFDPDQGVRLVSYAMHWIKAEIHEYILKNWRMVKVATTKSQRKLFFNLRSMKQGFKADAGLEDGAMHRETLSESEIDAMAAQLNVKREDVIEMETRLSGGDVLLDPSPSDDGEQAFGPIAYLADASHEAAPANVKSIAPARLPGQRRHCGGFGHPGRAQPPHCGRALAQGERRRLGRHDLARPGSDLRRQRRTHPPDRIGSDEENAQDFGRVRITVIPATPATHVALIPSIA